MRNAVYQKHFDCLNYVLIRTEKVEKYSAEAKKKRKEKTQMALVENDEENKFVNSWSLGEVNSKSGVR